MVANMDGWHLRLSSWALSSIGRAMGAKPTDAGSSPPFFPPNISQTDRQTGRQTKRWIYGEKKIHIFSQYPSISSSILGCHHALNIHQTDRWADRQTLIVNSSSLSSSSSSSSELLISIPPSPSPSPSPPPTAGT